MKTFKLTPHGISATKRTMLKIFIPVLLAAVTGGLLIGVLAGGTRHTDWVLLGIIIPSIAGLFIYMTIRSMHNMTAMLETLTLEIDENYITKSQLNFPDVVIERSQIKEIYETAKGDLVIKASNSKVIVVSRYIENRERVKALLADFAPVKPGKTNGLLYLILLLAAALGITGIFYMATNPAVIAASGIILILGIVITIILQFLSPLLSMRLKIASLFLLIIVVLILKRVLPALELL